MKPVPLESQLQRSVERRLKDLHRTDPSFVWRKRHGSAFTTAGDPDLFGCWRGVPFEIELKRPGESPTLLQAARLSEWAAAGARCFTIHSLPELDAAIGTLLDVVSGV